MKTKQIVYSAIVIGIIFAVICVSVVSFGKFKRSRQPKKEDPLMKYCCLKGKMDSKQFDNFLIHLSDERMTILRKTIGIIKQDDDDHKNDRLQKQQEIKDWLNWQSKHWATWLVTDKKVNYDEIVRWTAKKLKVENSETLSTFKVERKILNAMFEKIWDKMTPEQRKRALKNMSGSSEIKNIAGISVLSGSAALAALSGTVAFSGFAFYTGLSTFLYSAAAVFGVTLPFSAYMGASTAVAALSGPVGWCVIGLGATLGAAFIGQADYQKTAQLIIAVHMIKVDAIQKSGYDVNDFLETRPAKVK